MHLKIDTLLLADVFEIFRKMCLEIHLLDPAKFLSAPGLAWQADFKKTELKLELSSDIDMLLTVEKVIIVGICHSINRYATPNNKYMKDYNKNKESSYLSKSDENNLYGWVMSQKLTVNGFELVEDISQRYFLEVDVQCLEKLHVLHNASLFLPKIMKIEKVEKLVPNLRNDTEYLIHIRNLKQA